MAIRMRDDDPEDLDAKQIKSIRSTDWGKILIAVVAAIATGLSTTSIYTTQQIASDPNVRADPFTGTDAEKLENRLQKEFSRRLSDDLETNLRQWQSVADSIKRQHDSIEDLRDTVASMLARCASVQAADQSREAQLSDIRTLLYGHFGFGGTGHSHQTPTPPFKD